MAHRHNPYQRRNPTQRQRLYQEASDIFTRETIEDNHRLTDMIVELQDSNRRLLQRVDQERQNAIEENLNAEVFRAVFRTVTTENIQLYALFRRIFRENPRMQVRYGDAVENIAIGAGELHAHEVIDLTNED